ncbi:MAG TPA: hypothetical protein DEA97_14305 [Bacteroidales bacterium]|nr:MAG: hypothetical protein UR43_C0011G0028 [candidate division TM6 bacterium GW2011_GWF2_33_332]HBS87731.1 hypothetical protein [Bacteroidales bacterium]
MDISGSVRNVLKNKNIGIKELCAKANMPEVSFHRMLKTNDFKISVIEKIAETLNVDITEFFESNSISINRIKSLNEELAEQKKINQRLEKQLREYKEKLSYYYENADIDNIDSLSTEIVKNAINGKGLVYLEYNNESEYLEREYKELKEPLADEELGRIMVKIKYGNIKRKK